MNINTGTTNTILTMSQIIADTLKLIADNHDIILSAVRLAATNKKITMATLKISDISVGDWVYHDDIVYGREIAKVHRLNKNKDSETIGLTVYRSDGAFGVVGYILTSLTDNDIHPIPITAEILEKNGFKCFYEDADTALYGTPLCSIFHTKGTLRYRLETPQASVVCWNIHDLQHALRLAEVDKEINL